MTHLTRSLVALSFAVFLNACTSIHRPQLPAGPVAVVIDKDVRTHLHEVQEFFPLETAFCLTGGVLGSFIAVTNLQLAQHVTRTSTMASFYGCEQKQFIGIAHNHPNREGCDFSDVDHASFMRSKFAVIDVVVGRTCIRTRTKSGHDVVISR